MKLAAYGLCLILLGIPFATHASENLVAKREACRIEARSRIVANRKIEVEYYRRIVERRAAYVSQCLNRTFVASSNIPLPPQRVLNDAMDNNRSRVVTPGQNERRRIVARADRQKSRSVSIRTIKAMKLKRKKVRVSSRRSK